MPAKTPFSLCGPFAHLPVRTTAPLIRSYCLTCNVFVGASSKPEMLSLAESTHKCFASGGTKRLGPRLNSKPMQF